MGLRPRETVIIAEDFQAMGGWYQAILNFEAVNLVDEEYHYCNLKNEAGLQIGIAEAAELGVTPIDRRHNTVVLQFEVPDVKRLFERLRQRGGEISFGPSFDSKNGFWYGGFHDLEGNPFWAVDENCP
jgi:predicted enzyme related to lactoylglutathione lyase